MHVTIAVTIAALALLAPAAHAQPKLVPAAARYQVTTDGIATAAWDDGASVRVLRDDQPASRARTLARPAGCDSYPAVGAGVLAFFCRSGAPAPVVRLADLATGAISEAPGAAELQAYVDRNSANGAGFSVTGVGQALVRLHGSSEKDDFDFYVDRAGGRVFDAPVLPAHEIPDLRRPDAHSPMCGTLRAPSHRAGEFAGSARERDPATYLAPYLATLTRGRAVLRRCGARKPIVLGASAAEPVLTRRYVAWATHRRLTVRLLRNGRRLRFRLRPPAAGQIVPSLTGTGRRLWLRYGSGVRVLDLGA